MIKDDSNFESSRARKIYCPIVKNSTEKIFNKLINNVFNK